MLLYNSLYWMELVDERGQKRMARLVQAYRKAMEIQIIALYNYEQKINLSKGYNSRKPHWAFQ